MLGNGSSVRFRGSPPPPPLRAPCRCSRRVKGFVFFINKREGAANDPTNKYEIRSSITHTNSSPTTRYATSSLKHIVFAQIWLCSTTLLKHLFSFQNELEHLFFDVISFKDIVIYPIVLIVYWIRKKGNYWRARYLFKKAKKRYRFDLRVLPSISAEDI